MKFNKNLKTIVPVVLLFLAFNGFSKDTTLITISELQQQAKADPVKFNREYIGKTIFLSGVFWNKISSMEHYDFFPIKDFTGLFEAPWVSCIIPRNHDETFTKLKNKDTITVIAEYHKYFNDIIYLNNVKIMEHKTYQKLQPVASSQAQNNVKKRGSLKISAPMFTRGGATNGGRSRASIMRVVMQNIASIRYRYNKRLEVDENLEGKATVKFSIDHFGKVVKCDIVSSTVNDSILEKQVMDRVYKFQFEKIDKVGDTTEVVYPFVFAK